MLTIVSPDIKDYEANMGPTWGRQDPGGPQVGPMKLVIWVRLVNLYVTIYQTFQAALQTFTQQHCWKHQPLCFYILLIFWLNAHQSSCIKQHLDIGLRLVDIYVTIHQTFQASWQTFTQEVNCIHHPFCFYILLEYIKSLCNMILSKLKAITHLDWKLLCHIKCNFHMNHSSYDDDNNDDGNIDNNNDNDNNNNSYNIIMIMMWVWDIWGKCPW